MQGDGVTNQVTCQCGHLNGKGVFEVEGNWLVLRSPFGTKRVVLGVALPRRLARALLKAMCEREAARQRGAMGKGGVPVPDVIDTVGAKSTIAAEGAKTAAE